MKMSGGHALGWDEEFAGCSQQSFGAERLEQERHTRHRIREAVVFAEATHGQDANFRLELPHVAFHRQIGEFRDVQATPAGALVDAAGWEKQKDQWLPSTADGDFIASLMRQVIEPGKFASWIAPPRVGIDNKPGDFEYVKLAA